ncbi:MAG: hypothetical protein O2894_08740 [Planctomycetota bacterium]|nr:hypothetical protein [Planctomycetota bacterium]
MPTGLEPGTSPLGGDDDAYIPTAGRGHVPLGAVGLLLFAVILLRAELGLLPPGLLSAALLRAGDRPRARDNRRDAGRTSAGRDARRCGLRTSRSGAALDGLCAGVQAGL